MLNSLFGLTSEDRKTKGKKKAVKKGEDGAGSGSEEEEFTLNYATTKIEDRVKQLDKKIKELDQELMRYNQKINKANASVKQGIQKRALAVLKRKRMYEQQRDNLTNQAFNIEQTSFAIETVKDTQKTLEAMKSATVTLKTEHEKINIDEIEDMQDDLADLLEDQEEMNEIISRSYATPEYLDEDDLNAELAGLEDEFEGIDLEEEVSAPVSMPLNPINPPETVFSASGNKEDAPKVAVDQYNLPI